MGVVVFSWNKVKAAMCSDILSAMYWLESMSIYMELKLKWEIGERKAHCLCFNIPNSLSSRSRKEWIAEISVSNTFKETFTFRGTTLGSVKASLFNVKLACSNLIVGWEMDVNIWNSRANTWGRNHNAIGWVLREYAVTMVYEEHLDHRSHELTQPKIKGGMRTFPRLKNVCTSVQTRKCNNVSFWPN